MSAPLDEDHGSEAGGSSRTAKLLEAPTVRSTQSFERNVANDSATQIFGNSGNVTINHNAGSYEKPPDEVFDAPDLLSPYFTGRSAELEEIQEVFDNPKEETPTRCAIWGMPGLGKTQVALRYAAAAFKDKKFAFVFWMSVSSVEKINQGFSKIPELVCYPGRSGMDQTAKIAAARHWLEDTSSRPGAKWLLVLDNAHPDAVGELRNILPQRNPNGRILITTRTKATAEQLSIASGTKHSVLELKQPSSDDAVDLLLKRTSFPLTDSGVRETAREVVQSVGRLPLAVDQAGSFMKASDSGVTELLGIYKSKEVEKVMDWENSLSLHEEQSVTATFKLAFEQLSDTAPASVNLLRVFAFLDPESIPIELLVKGSTALQQSHRTSLFFKGLKGKFKDWSKTVSSSANERLKDWSKIVPSSANERPTLSTFDSNQGFERVMTLFQSQVELQEAIQQLQRLSLVISKDDDGLQALWIHDLVHMLLRTKLMRDSDQPKWLKHTISIISEAWDQIEDRRLPENWPYCERFVAHFRCLTEHAATLGVKSERLLESNVWVANYLFAAGRWDEGSKLEKQVVEGRTALLGPEHPDTLASIYNLAVTYRDLGRFEEAEQLGIQVLETEKKVLGPENHQTLMSMSYLASTYSIRGEFDKAEKLESEALEIKKRVLGEEHRDTLVSMSNLALTYNKQGHLDRAEEMELKVIEVESRTLGAENPSTLTSMSNLAYTYNKKGQLGKAEELEMKVLEIKKRLLGPEHPDTLVGMSNLAFTWVELGRKEEAIQLMMETLELREKKLGPNHPDTQTCRDALESWLE